MHRVSPFYSSKIYIENMYLYSISSKFLDILTDAFPLCLKNIRNFSEGPLSEIVWINSKDLL